MNATQITIEVLDEEVQDFLIYGTVDMSSQIDWDQYMDDQWTARCDMLDMMSDAMETW